MSNLDTSKLQCEVIVWFIYPEIDNFKCLILVIWLGN